MILGMKPKTLNYRYCELVKDSKIRILRFKEIPLTLPEKVGKSIVFTTHESAPWTEFRGFNDHVSDANRQDKKKITTGWLVGTVHIPPPPPDVNFKAQA